MALDFNTFYNEVILNKIIAGSIIFFLGFMIGKLFSNILKKIFYEIDLNDKFSNILLNKINIEKIIVKFVEYSIYTVTIILTLRKLGIASFIVKGLIIFGIALIILTIILDLKDLIPNMIAYIKIRKNKYYTKGDRIKIHLASGIVKKISFITTRIITDHNDELVIQNYSVVENFVVEKKTIIEN